MQGGRGFVAVAVALAVASAGLGFRGAMAAESAADGAGLRETICRMVDAAAEGNRLPAAFLTRILWQESGFRTDVTSPAGAEGVAQFMPDTAAERGLADPYEPGPAIAQAARLLAELARRFGNLGLAAAAYNAGPARVAKWLRAETTLPTETELYVLAVTGHRAAEWAAIHGGVPAVGEPQPCLAVTADLAHPTAMQLAGAPTVPARRMAAWQAHLDMFLARAVRLRQQPPGTVPVSNSNRAAAGLCDRIRAMGMPCTVFER